MKPLWLSLVVAALAGCAALPAAPLTGTWRSIQAELTLTELGGTVEFGCARGTLGAVKPDASGAFKVAGTFTRLSPVERVGEPPPTPEPVTYLGRVTGDTLTFALEFPSGDKNGEITVVKDGDKFVIRCA